MIIYAASCAGILWGQTMVDLRTQSKSIDFSGANATKPFKSGTVLPSICAVGEIFYKLDATAGANLYGCTSANAWTLEQSSPAGSGLPAMTGNSGRVLGTDGTNAFWSALGGDVSGSPSSVTVTQIQSRAVSSAAPASGQALAWNASTNRWEPSTIGTSGGGGSGASLASQLGDFAVTRVSASTLNIGANCSIATPCAVRFGGLVFSFPNGASVTVTAGTGLAYVYIASSGALTVGHNLTASCTACVAQAGVTAFPADAIPLFTWSATSGSWDLTGGTDWRAFLSSKSVVPGSGLTSVESSGKTILSVDPVFAGQRTSPPATSSSTCTPGSWATDSSFYYVCVSQNSWRRVGISLW